MRTRTSVTLAALLTAGLTPLTLSTPASAAPAKYADDFNGDGYGDLVVGAPDATVSGKTGAGAVVVLYGSASGPGTALNADGKAELGVGAAGVALVLRGTSTTPTASGAVTLPDFGGSFLD
ncbi:hypothetical protein GCM10011579_055440 [Streptomyces albiflavescens]|uniref:Integrin n=1 Tax=Streptomyces albiflavescens TaxID=1623582 RepID=A0A917Y9I6_9ACTN|nr:integrin alpha [Streptomyces albiflavescens]GGN75393.1 hypothetical protein GCM10011579_055440 [Streptomyces albiflavescens]